MSKPDDFYNVEPQARKLEELGKQSCGYCSVHPPLLNIQLSHIVAGELHLLLRITDVMLKNLILDVKECDTREEFAGKQDKEKHLAKLVQAINRCGVSFSVWETKNADGSGSGMWDFTSLMGNGKKSLLNSLPDQLNGILQPETEITVIEIWKVCTGRVNYTVFFETI